MEKSKSVSLEVLWRTSEQLFHCPCGKSYRSYPAIFTHIKNKHQGRPPGNIIKPQCQPKKRGRPPVHKKDNSSETNVTLRTEADSFCYSDYEIQQKSTEENVNQMTKIKEILESLPFQRVNGGRLSEVNAILEMNVYLVSGVEQGQMGKALREFLLELSRIVQWEKFQQMFTLLMLLLQFTTDSMGNQCLLTEGQVDLLCDHINAFSQGGLTKMTNRYEIAHLSIFQTGVILPLFQAFFQWLMARKYTNYRITLNSDFVGAL